MIDRNNSRLVSPLVSARRPAAREEGQTLVEYALILATVSIGVTTAMLFLKGKLDDVFTTIGGAV